MGYEIYGLKENPFPRVPILAPDSKDPRENGSIFSVNARAKEIKEFEEKYVGTKTTFDDRYRGGWGRMSIVDTKPFMLLSAQHSISVYKL